MLLLVVLFVTAWATVPFAADIYKHGYVDSVLGQTITAARQARFGRALAEDLLHDAGARRGVLLQVLLAVVSGLAIAGAAAASGYVSWFAIVAGAVLAVVCVIQSFWTRPSATESAARLRSHLQTTIVVVFGAIVTLLGSRLAGDAIQANVPRSPAATAVPAPDAATLAPIRWCKTLFVNTLLVGEPQQASPECALATELQFYDADILSDYWTSGTPVPGGKQKASGWLALWLSQADSMGAPRSNSWSDYLAANASATPDLGKWLSNVQASNATPQAPLPTTGVPSVSLRGVALYKDSDAGTELAASVFYGQLNGTPTPAFYSPWLFAYDRATSRFYPSTEPNSVPSGGVVGVVQLGTANQSVALPERYELRLVFVNADARIELRRYLADRSRDQLWSQGLQRVPDGSTTIASWGATTR